MRKTRELIYDLLVLLSDVLAIISAYVVAYAIRAKLVEKPLAYPYGFMKYLRAIISFLPLWIIIFAAVGLYKTGRSQNRLAQLGQLIVATAGGTLALILIDFFRTTPLFPSKGISILGFGLSLLFVVLGREVLHSIRRVLIRAGKWTKRVALIGKEDQTATRILKALKNEGGKIVAVVAERKWGNNYHHYNNVEEFITHLKQLQLDEVIQMDPELNRTSELKLVQACHAHKVSFRLVPNIIGLATAHQELSTLDGVPVIDIKPTPLDGWGRIIKRVFDFVAALLLVSILSPLFLVLALIIKLSDNGPVFYRQHRLSRDRASVNIIKFRTLQPAYSGLPDKQAFSKLGKPELYDEFMKEKKLADDPRLTRLGGWLRRTSLDELPQLFNVLSGQLSLVGPRPMLEDELERFGDKNLSSILALKCGMTGLWQVSGRSDIGFEGRVRLDLYYVENWSLWLDIKILLKTAGVILRRQGAY